MDNGSNNGYYRLKDLVNIKWIMPPTPIFKECGIKYITSKNIKNSTIDFYNCKFISLDDYEKINKNWKIKTNDLLLSMIGTIGEIAIVDYKYGKFTGQNFVVIIPKKIITKYLFYLFHKNKTKKFLIDNSIGSTQKYLSLPILKSIPIYSPPLPTQQKIIDIIEPIETLETNINNLIKKIKKIINFLNILKIKNLNNNPNIIFTTQKGEVISNPAGIFRYVNNSKNISYCDKYNNNGTAILVTTRGTLTTHIVFNKWYATNNIYVLRGYGIFSNIYNINQMIIKNTTGSTIPMITKQNIVSSIKKYNLKIENILESLYKFLNSTYDLNNYLQILKSRIIKILIK